MGFAIGYVKGLLLMFIVVFMFSGVTLITTSAFVFQEVKDYGRVGDFVEGRYYGPLITLMVVGSLIIMIAVYGVVSIAKENQNMIITFAALIFALFICEVTVSSVAFLRSNDIGSNIKDKMRKSLAEYPSDRNKRSAFDSMQRNLECCGVASPLDYLPVFLNSSVPSSCCTKDKGFLCSQSLSSKVIHHTGCHLSLTRYITRAGVILGSLTISVAFVGIVGIILSILLVIALIKDERCLDKRATELGSLEEEHKLTSDRLS